MSMKPDIKHNGLLSGAIVLGILLDVGCGGTIDLTQLKQSDGSGSTSSSSAGKAGDHSLGSGGQGADDGGLGGSSNGGSTTGGSPSAGSPGGGASGQIGTACAVDEDCAECIYQTDPIDSGCYTPCCDSTAMTPAACEQNLQSFKRLCPELVCDALCAPKPTPKCVSRQCVHG